ncbi:MAG: hypothetical protein ACRC1F_00805, partial [Metamycoplasmataceae bacterium]
MSINEDFLKLDNNNFKKIFTKKTCYIFGKNGSGKTTISRKISNSFKETHDLFIFNKDYIKNNVFIQDSKKESIDAQKISSDNKSNTFNIFLGKPLVDITRKISENESERILNQENLEKSFSIETELKEWLIFLKIDKQTYNKKYFDGKKNRMEILETINHIYKKNNRTNIFNDIRNKVNSLKLTKERDSIGDDFNKLIKILEKQNSNFDEFNDHWQKTTKLQKVIELHRKALELSEPEGYIEFLGKNIEKTVISQYLKDNTSKKNEILINIDSDKKTISFNSEKIKSAIKRLNLDLIYDKMIIDIDEILKNNDLKIKENEEFCSKFKLYEKHKEDKTREMDDIKNQIEKNWVILTIKIDNLDAIKNDFDLYQKISDNTNSLKEQKQKLEKDFNDSFVAKINKTIKYISKDDFGIEIKNSSRTNEHFLEIKSKNKNIEHFSEGEKNTLAISYFLVDLEINYKNISKDFIVFIDDPFDSNDHFKYDYLFGLEFDFNEEKLNFNQLLMKIEESKMIKSNYIISTHNINVLSAFIRNLKDPKNATGNELFYKMKNEQYINLFHLKKKIDNNVEIIDLDI